MRKYAYSSVSTPAQLGVDPTFQAARIALYPIAYKDKGISLGHFRAAAINQQVNGLTVQIAQFGLAPGLDDFSVGPSALSDRLYLVLLRLSMLAVVTTAFSTATVFAFQSRVWREVKNITSAGARRVEPTPLHKTDKRSKTLVYIDAGSATMTGINNTNGTPDSRFFGYAVFPDNDSVVSAASVNQAAEFATLYQLTPGQSHPVVLRKQEAVQVETETINLSAAGALRMYFLAEWAEVQVY